MGAEGSGAGVQIFDESQLRDKIEGGSICFPEASPIEEDSPDAVHYIMGMIHSRHCS